MAQFTSFDGRSIAYTERGEGPAVLFVHGFLANALVNWVRPGVAEIVAAAGWRVILPDLRGHGASDAPDEPAAYPPDVLAMDQERLLAHLGVSASAVVGYSLGARTTIRMLARGFRPKAAVIAGMGESAVSGGDRRAFFEAAIRGEDTSPAAAQIRSFLDSTGVSPAAALNVLASQRDTPAATLGAIATPVLCLAGDRDADNGSAEILARYFPNGQARRTPGSHLSAPGSPAFAEAIVDFLNAHR